MDFVKTRVCFIALSDKDVRFKTDASDGRTCKEWAMQEFGISEDTWANSVRGYMLPGRLQFFTGTDYAEANVPPRILSTAVDTYVSVYGEKPPAYYNGVMPGKPGEVWEPISAHGIADYL